jgi:hypothetical protein
MANAKAQKHDGSREEIFSRRLYFAMMEALWAEHQEWMGARCSKLGVLGKKVHHGTVWQNWFGS